MTESPQARPSFDLIVVGAGVIGCGIAREFAGRGHRVAVVERGEPGLEASSAAAGLLAPQAECLAPGPFFSLGLESRQLHESWAVELLRETGIDVGYRRCGILRCSFRSGGELLGRFGWQSRAGLAVESVSGRQIGARAGGFPARSVTEALFFPDEAIVDSPTFADAVAESARRRGAEFFCQTTARRFVVRAGRCVGVETGAGVFEAEQIVDAAGAWAGFDRSLPLAIPIVTVRGQMVELSPAARELPTVVQDDDVYLVPRRGGTVFAGATVERVGYDKKVTATGVSSLLSAAIRLAPDLADAEFTRAWAGLRPGTVDGLPILGATPVPGLFVAAGHFRNGILLAPATAVHMADLLESGSDPTLEPFSVARFAKAAEPFSQPAPVTGVFG